jgi:hypothetical protein
MRSVSRDHAITQLRRFILVRLCMYRGKDGRCNPSYDTIAKELDVDRITVIRAVAVGVQRGWLAPTTSRGRTTNNFVFLFPQQLHPSNRSEPSTVAPEQPLDTPTVAPEHANSCTGVSPTVARVQPKRNKRTGKENGRKKDSLANARESDPPGGDLFGKKKEASSKKESKATGADADFEAFWAVYPRKVDRPDARKAFAAARKQGIAADVLIEGARRYGAERAGQEPRYTKHPATWLRKQSWANPNEDGPPIIDGVTGEVIPAPPQPRSNGAYHRHETAPEQAARLAAMLEARDGRR